MSIINMTPHDEIIRDPDSLEEIHRYRRSGSTLRLQVDPVGETPEDFPLVNFGQLNEDPPMREGLFYIVSLPIALAVKRPDFLVPFGEIRDEVGRIIGCQRLVLVA